jgi:hypothetical protein
LEGALRPFARLADVKPVEKRQNGDVIIVIATDLGEAKLLYSDFDRAREVLTGVA